MENPRRAWGKIPHRWWITPWRTGDNPRSAVENPTKKGARGPTGLMYNPLVARFSGFPPVIHHSLAAAANLSPGDGQGRELLDALGHAQVGRQVAQRTADLPGVSLLVLTGPHRAWARMASRNPGSTAVWPVGQSIEEHPFASALARLPGSDPGRHAFNRCKRNIPPLCCALSGSAADVATSPDPSYPQAKRAAAKQAIATTQLSCASSGVFKFRTGQAARPCG